MKTKSIIGLVAGALLILSAGAHSILGWKAMSEQLAQTNAPPDLVQGLRMGWMFGGPVMLVFGILSITTFLKRFRGDLESLALTLRERARALIDIAHPDFREALTAAARERHLLT